MSSSISDNSKSSIATLSSETFTSSGNRSINSLQAEEEPLVPEGNISGVSSNITENNFKPDRYSTPKQKSISDQNFISDDLHSVKFKESKMDSENDIMEEIIKTCEEATQVEAEESFTSLTVNTGADSQQSEIERTSISDYADENIPHRDKYKIEKKYISKTGYEIANNKSICKHMQKINDPNEKTEEKIIENIAKRKKNPTEILCEVDNLIVEPVKVETISPYFTVKGQTQKNISNNVYDNRKNEKKFFDSNDIMKDWAASNKTEKELLHPSTEMVPEFGNLMVEPLQEDVIIAQKKKSAKKIIILNEIILKPPREETISPIITFKEITRKNISAKKVIEQVVTSQIQESINDDFYNVKFKETQVFETVSTMVCKNDKLEHGKKTFEDATQVDSEEMFSSLTVNTGVASQQSEIECINMRDYVEENIPLEVHSDKYNIEEKSFSKIVTGKGVENEKAEIVKDCDAKKTIETELLLPSTEIVPDEFGNLMVEPARDETISPIITFKDITQKTILKNTSGKNLIVLDEIAPTQKAKLKETSTEVGEVMNEQPQDDNPIIAGKILKKVSKNICDKSINSPKIKEKRNRLKAPAKKIKKPKPLNITTKKSLDFFGNIVKKSKDSYKPDISLRKQNRSLFCDVSSGLEKQGGAAKLRNQPAKVQSTAKEFGHIELKTIDQAKKQSNPAFDIPKGDVEINLKKKNPSPILRYNGSSGSEEEGGAYKLVAEQAEVHFGTGKESGVVEKESIDTFDKTQPFERAENNSKNSNQAAASPQDVFDKLLNQYLADLHSNKTAKSTPKKRSTRSSARYSYLERATEDYHMRMLVEKDKVDTPTRPIKKAHHKRSRKKKVKFDIEETISVLTKMDQNRADIISARSEKKPTEIAQIKSKKTDTYSSKLCPHECDKIDDPIIDIAVRSANENIVEDVGDDFDHIAISEVTNDAIELLDDPDRAVSPAPNEKVKLPDEAKAIHGSLDRINALQVTTLSSGKRHLPDHCESPIIKKTKSVQTEEETAISNIDQESFSTALRLISSDLRSICSDLGSICSNLPSICSALDSLASNVEISKKH